MPDRWLSPVSAVLSCTILSLTLATCGCGDEEAGPLQAAAAAIESPEIPAAPPTAERQPEPQTAETPQQTARRYLAELRALREAPLPADRDTAANRKRRQQQAVEVANKAIALTHADQQTQEEFAQAVAELMEARLQLALSGEDHEVAALHSDAESVCTTYPKSEAASHATFALARFAHAQAEQHSETEPRWLTEFARHARRFASDYPDAALRGAPMLDAAAQSCELYGRNADASVCYKQLASTWPQTTQGQNATASLRRLELVGKSLRLAGPTLDGRFLSIDQYRGEVVLVHFWSTDNVKSAESLPTLAHAAQQFAGRGVRLIGVNLNTERADVERALQAHSITWPQLFPPQSQDRRWSHPVVQYYGLRSIPAYWVVGRDGVVQAMTSDVAEAMATLARYGKPAPR